MPQGPELDEDNTTRLDRPDGAPARVLPGPREEGVLTVLRGPNAGGLFTLDGPRTLIGRSSEAQVMLTDAAMSRRHSAIARTPEGYFIEDLGSANGTIVDGVKIAELTQLHDGSRIEVGAHTLLRFGLHDAVEREAARRTHDLMVRDPLTSLFNRRHLYERLHSEAAFALRHNTPLAVLLVDIDGFKQINDTHGHAVGDSVLRILSRALTQTVRTEDVLARYGGEEFVIVARGIEVEGVRVLGDRIVRATAALRVPSTKTPVPVSVSVGVAHSTLINSHEPEVLLRAADEAMYTAKRSGRNRAVLASNTPINRATYRLSPQDAAFIRERTTGSTSTGNG
jgi:two-component system cell cycle response regulator